LAVRVHSCSTRNSFLNNVLNKQSKERKRGKQRNTEENEIKKKLKCDPFRKYFAFDDTSYRLIV